MDKPHESATAAVGSLVEERMSRCLFGDWPRRALLKLRLPACDRTSSFCPREERNQNNPASVSQVGT